MFKRGDRVYNSEIRNQKSEIRNQKSEIRNQKSEIRNQKSLIGMGLSIVMLLPMMVIPYNVGSTIINVDFPGISIVVHVENDPSLATWYDGEVSRSIINADVSMIGLLNGRYLNGRNAKNLYFIAEKTQVQTSSKEVKLTSKIITRSTTSTWNERQRKLSYIFSYDIPNQKSLQRTLPDLPPDDLSVFTCASDQYRIQGQLFYYVLNKKIRSDDSLTWTRPLVWASVNIKVVYRDPNLGYNNPLYSRTFNVLTNRYGQFFGCIPQKVLLSEDIYKLTITVSAANSFVGGIWPNGLSKSYSVKFGPYYDLSDDFDLSQKIITSADYATEDAFRLFSALTAGWAFVIAHTQESLDDGSVTSSLPGPVEVWYPYRWPLLPSNALANYNRPLKVISLWSPLTAQYPFIILHEYGHHVFMEAFPNNIFNGAHVTFLEGFADFFAISVLDDPQPLEGGESYDGSIVPEISMDFESEVLQQSVRNLPESLDLSQVKITKILWDFSDDSPLESVTTTFAKGGLVTTTSTLDQVSFGFNGIWKIIKQHYQTRSGTVHITFEYFWKIITEMFPADIVRKVCAMMSLHYLFPTCEATGGEPYLSSYALILSNATKRSTEVLITPILDIGSPLNAGPYLAPNGYQWTVKIDQWDQYRRKWVNYKQVSLDSYYYEEILSSSSDYRITVAVPDVADKIAGITKQVVIKHYSPPPPPGCSPITGCKILPFSSVVDPFYPIGKVQLLPYEEVYAVVDFSSNDGISQRDATITIAVKNDTH